MDIVKKSDKPQWLDEFTDSLLQAFDMDKLCDSIGKYIYVKYRAELDDVQDVQIRSHIMEQRLPIAVEESGLMSAIIEEFGKLGITDRMTALEKEKIDLQKDVQLLRQKIDAMIDEMNTLQINTFGRVISLFDNRIIDLAGEDIDIEVIEKPSTQTLDVSLTLPSGSSVEWRVLQPSELLIGLKLALNQSVLCRNNRETWFPGRISAFSPQTSNQPGNATSPTSIVTNGTTKGEGMQEYKVILDAAPGMKADICTAKTTSLALAVSASELRQKYPVGTRVVSIYRDESGGIGYYSGLIAEPPSERNNNRYLLFFDDGYTQYSPPTEIYRICYQSKENWREASEGSQDFIKRYLAQYPQRPMVRLKQNQVIETELDGEWIQASVEAVDASLALIRFSATHSEWIYRGSTRLEPLFTDMASKQNQQATNSDTGVEVEYSNVDGSLNDSTAIAKRRKTRKSVTGNQDTGEASQQQQRSKPPGSLPDKPMALTRSSTAAAAASAALFSDRHPAGHRGDTASERGPPALVIDSESCGVVVPYLNHLFEDLERKQHKTFVPHKCDSNCLLAGDSPSGKISEDPIDYKGLNPLEIPFHAGWVRYMLVSSDDSGRQVIVYNAPCGRQLRSMHEVQRFLDRTNSKLTSDLFCFDPTLVINSEFRAEKTLTNIADLSYGKENVPVPCVNSVDNEVPPYIDYIPHRQPVGTVPLVEDANFMVCCECTDNCRDRSKCACQQLTAEASALTNPSGMVDYQAGYRYRRLAQFTVGGLYECNAGCPCDRRCSNRVVQHGLWARLQVFKTSRKGWGIRALHAIPKGSFVCTYAGAIYDENMAVKEGFDFGDEYQAELDYIETVEKPKDGYESFPEDPDDPQQQQMASAAAKGKPSIIQPRNTTVSELPTKASITVVKARSNASVTRNTGSCKKPESLPEPQLPPPPIRSVKIVVPRCHSDVDLLVEGCRDVCNSSVVSSLSRNTSSVSSSSSTSDSNSTSTAATSSTPSSKSSSAVSEDEGQEGFAGGRLITTGGQYTQGEINPVYVALETLPSLECAGEMSADGSLPVGEQSSDAPGDSVADQASSGQTVAVGSVKEETGVEETVVLAECDSPISPGGSAAVRVTADAEEARLSSALCKEDEVDNGSTAASENLVEEVVSANEQTVKKGVEVKPQATGVQKADESLEPPDFALVISSDDEDEPMIHRVETAITATTSVRSASLPPLFPCGKYSEAAAPEAKNHQPLTRWKSAPCLSCYPTDWSSGAAVDALRLFCSYRQASPMLVDSSPELPRGVPSPGARVRASPYREPIAFNGSSLLERLGASPASNEGGLLGEQATELPTCSSVNRLGSSATDTGSSDVGSSKPSKRKCIEITTVSGAADAEMLPVSIRSSQVSAAAGLSTSSAPQKAKRVVDARPLLTSRSTCPVAAGIQRKRRKRLSYSQQYQSAMIRRRRYRAKQKARSQGLPVDFNRIRNVWQLLKEADFGRTPVIQLSPLPTDSASASTSAGGEALTSWPEKKLTRPLHQQRQEGQKIKSKTSSGHVKEVKVRLHKDENMVDQDPGLKMGDKVERGIPKKEEDASGNELACGPELDKRRSPLTLRLRRVVSCDQLGVTTSFTRVKSRSSSPMVKSSCPDQKPETHSRPTTVSRYPKRDLTKKPTRSLSMVSSSRELRSANRPTREKDAPASLHHGSRHRHHHHHHLRHHQHHFDHHHHHLRERRPKEAQKTADTLAQQQQQQQSSFRRFYPVAQTDWLLARTYFGDENPYIMDAKRMGNLGRYFNHSCNPNVFVQNVFINSHDPRFPEVAFFTKRNIAVGEEITWDYGYTVDAVPYKVLYCYCGEPSCRVRLL